MRHEAPLLDDGTRGTSAEPFSGPWRVPGKWATDHRLMPFGTLGTRGTLEFQAKRPALTDAHAERLAIYIEADDVTKEAAKATIAAEIGTEFMCGFIAPSRDLK